MTQYMDFSIVLWSGLIHHVTNLALIRALPLPAGLEAMWTKSQAIDRFANVHPLHAFDGLKSLIWCSLDDDGVQCCFADRMQDLANQLESLDGDLGALLGEDSPPTPVSRERQVDSRLADLDANLGFLASDEQAVNPTGAWSCFGSIEPHVYFLRHCCRFFCDFYNCFPTQFDHVAIIEKLHWIFIVKLSSLCNY